MVLGGIQAFNLVSILLLLVPGWLGVKLYLDGVSRSDRLGRIDTVVVSIGVSLCVLLGLSVTFCLYYFAGLLILTHQMGPLTRPYSGLRLLVESPVFAGINYLALVSSAALLGNYCADNGYLIGQLPDAPNRVWRTRLEAVENSPGDDKVRVVTTDGDHIVGELENWSVDSRDLVVENPKRIELGVSGAERLVRSYDSSVYVRDSEVSRVYVENPESGDKSSADPDRPGTSPDREIGELDRTVLEGDSSDK